MSDTSKMRILVDKALTDSMWRPGREIVFVTPPKYAPQSPIPVDAVGHVHRARPDSADPAHAGERL